MRPETERALRANDPGFSTDLSTGFVDKRITLILQIALDTPLRRVFDYLPPKDACDSPAWGSPKLGVRVRVPFGRRQLVGVLVGVAQDSPIAGAKLKHAGQILDEEAIFDPVTFELLRWAAEYYHHPLGEVIAAALPVALRLGQAANDIVESWALSDAGRQELTRPTGRRGPQQRALLRWLAERGPATTTQVAAAFKPTHLRALAARGWASATRLMPDPAPFE